MSSINCSASEVKNNAGGHLVYSVTATSSAANLSAHLFESKDPATLKTGLLIAAAILSVLGNGASLVVIWKTPKLHTKTFALLFNLTVVDLFNGLALIWYLVLVAVMAFAHRYPFYVSMNSVGLIAYERYIAVVLPLRYETLVTDKTMKVAVALVWILCLPLTATFLLLLGQIDWKLCTIPGLVRQALITDATCLLTAFTVIGGLHGHLLVIALQQQAKINVEVAQVQTVAGGAMTAAVTARRKLRAELKAVRLTASVVGSVIILWTPYLIGDLILIGGTNPILGQYVTDIGTALGSANFSINWILYGLVSRDFRHSALRLFRCRKQTVGGESRTDNSKLNADTNKQDVMQPGDVTDCITSPRPITMPTSSQLESSHTMTSPV